MKRLGALLASLLLAGSLTACGGTAAQEMQSIQVFAMDTVMGLRACGGETEAALAAAEDEIYRLDEALSRTREDSAVSRLNSAAGGTPVDVGEELRDLIARALDFSAATDGAFDITLAPVSSAWGFTEDTYRVPEDAELALLLPCVGAEHVHLEEGTAVSLDQGTRIDLGAIAKGMPATGWLRFTRSTASPTASWTWVGTPGSAAGTWRGSPGRSAFRTRPGPRGLWRGSWRRRTPLPSPPAAISGILRKMDSSITISLILPPAARRRADLPPSPWWRMGPRATARCATPSPRPCSSWGRTGRWSSGAAASMTLT
ncbi:FAD:protein FMN transferase [Dysosmobacter welbionis]|uniref:FAD:protein FMN transferase n=1 Tax=Dysosmobacter welbionis TaxID=2093857 RepID=A0A856I2C0_9FIRM|nr:FAD:protein FMN transferase [Dysosmobacter welbionis]